MFSTPQSHDAAKGDPSRVGRYGTRHCGRNLNDEVLMPSPSVMDSAGFCGKPDKGRMGPTSGRTLLGNVLELEGRGPHAEMYMTPNCMDGMPGKSQKALDHEHTHRKGRKSPNNLRDQIAVDEGERKWPSPRGNSGGGECEHGAGGPDLQTAIKRVPTPQSRDYKSGKASHETMIKNSRPLNEVVGGQLNLDWTEVLMGWPPGWTSLEPLTLEVWNMWQDQFSAWWPSHSPTAWHCLELIYPRLTTIKENRTNRLKAIGNGQVPQSKVKAIKFNMEAL